MDEFENILPEELSYHRFKMGFTKDCIFGQIGLSLNLDSILCMTNSLFNYLNLKGIQAVVIGNDSSLWAKTFGDVIAERLLELGVEVHILSSPSSSALLSWATNKFWTDSERSAKPLGMYLGSDSSQHSILSIHLRDEEGLPYTEEQIGEVVAQSFRVQTVDLGLIGRPILPEYIEVNERYITDLKNTKLLDKNLLKKSMVSIDNMFGPSEYILQHLKKEFLFSGQLVNKSSENLRINNYQSIPSERWLQWKIPGKNNTMPYKDKIKVHAAINNLGDQLGVWDVKQSLEISPSGIYMIFLKYFGDRLHRRGTVMISKALSDKVVEVAKHYGFKVQLIDSGPDRFAKAYTEIGKRSALMYGDEFGRFWFKGQPLEPNAAVSLLTLLQICELYRMSPGEIVDATSSKLLTRKYVYGKLFVPVFRKTRDELEEIIRRDLSIVEEDAGNTTVLRNDYGVKVSLSYDHKLRTTLVDVESMDENTTREVVEDLKKKVLDYKGEEIDTLENPVA
jgi:hypothetical protein